MDNSVSNNNFYKTFTPFITPKTRTAEKTMHGKDFVVYTPPSNITKTFYRYISAGGFLIVPILAILLSKKNLSSIMQKANLEHFRAINSEKNGFLGWFPEYFAKFKQNLCKKVMSVLQPYTRKKDLWTTKLNNKSNNSFVGKIFRKTNDFFISLKTKAAERKYKKLEKNFAALEKLLKEQFEIIKRSGTGEIKILFPKKLLKNPLDEMPQTVDLSKTASGLDRAKLAQEILDKIKNLMKNSKNYGEIAEKITYSCEDIFKKAESKLVSLEKAINMQGMNNANIRRSIKEVYDELIKFRYAEYIPNNPNASTKSARKFYIDKTNKLFENLKSQISNPEKIKLQLEGFEKAITECPKGLIEELRDILKCNDIQSSYILQEKTPSLFKYYRPEEYIKVKRKINDFASELKSAEKIQNKLLPNAINSIEKGNVITNLLSIIIPSSFLMLNHAKSTDKTKEKRNLISFMLGAITMIGTQYFSMCTRTSSILYGLGTAFITSKLFNKFMAK